MHLADQSLIVRAGHLATWALGRGALLRATARCRLSDCCLAWGRAGFDPLPETSEAELGRIVADLAARKQAWVATPAAERGRLLRACVDTTLAVRWGAGGLANGALGWQYRG